VVGSAAKIVYVVSDSLGETAEQVARAALGQFDPGLFRVIRVPRIRTERQLEDWVVSTCVGGCTIFYTLAAPELRTCMERLMRENDVVAVDVLGPAVTALERATDARPAWVAGTIRVRGGGYLQWFEALEFAFRHDDGKHVEELGMADIVLIGVSRTAKTPLSMYLAFKGYAVANIPLIADVDPPSELFTVDPAKVFGLVTEPGLLTEIRRQRAREMGPAGDRYASREFVEKELASASRLMRQLGCHVLVTGDRAIEETAQEVVRRLER
jgi:regulator of PEP synthase PpsR (kinase-PPPase family)